MAMSIVLPSFPALSFAEDLSNVTFYNNATGTPIKSLDEASDVYAEVTFDATSDSSTLVAAHYDYSGVLTKTEFINPVSSVSGQNVTYTTPSFSVKNSDVVKVFAWDGLNSMKPLLQAPGVIAKSVPLPSATINTLDTSLISVPLTFAMNFKADAATDEQLIVYGDWHSDFVLTVNKDVKYNADGTADAYLAGQYDSWSSSWLAVPNKTYEVKADNPIKIMESAAAIYGEPGLKYTYREVYERVKNFNCGVFFNEKFLAENPDLKATLELRIYNPKNTNESYRIGESYQFTLPGASVDSTVLTSGNVTAVVPSSVVLQNGIEGLKLTTKSLADSQSGISADENEKLTSYDIHIEGISEDNTTPIIITLPEAADKGLNKGNLSLYHVENGETVSMEEVESEEDLIKHNQFTYEPLDGTITLAMATFSEVALLSDTEKKWEGNYDYSWYGDGSSSDYKIANADQLAAFGQIVGGMSGDINRDSFSGKTVTLTADINLGDAEAANDKNKIFYPIGYYNTLKSYDKISGKAIESGVKSFAGTFDGAGHTISNFYQNTWEMFGDYNDGYSGTPNHYKDAMGLFGYVYNGTVKNLTVDNFSSDGEFTPTGVIAAFAVNSTFENIAITDCNPRVYNTGNGGIVGIGGDSSDTSEKKLTFTNITIDNTNKISALWGSWDVACGGLMGMFRGYSTVKFTNCHVAAQIDVYNDVCGNYQYYWYRYSGMMIGSLRGRNTTDKDGYTVPDMTDISAENCTVHFGKWNDYYYCELVANSLASYTHDHQFSRLNQISTLDEIKSGNTWTKAGNFLLISGNTKTCYHIVKNADGTFRQHLHTDAGEETVNGETVLKENNQIVYLPFNQLFQGDGWGVKHIPIYNGEKYAFDGITILDREVADSVVKFEKADTAKEEYFTETKVTIGELFAAATIEDPKLSIKKENVQVTVSPVGDESTVTATYEAYTEDWTKGTLTFSGTGKATVTITDYYFCKPTTINVEITKRFVKKFSNNKFTYRIGNQNAVSLETLFVGANNVNSSKVDVTFTDINDTGATGTYTENADWKKSTIQFTGTGVVEVSITDDDNCTPAYLTLEVVDAVNATTATSATKNNVVLLNDCGFGSLEVSGGYTLYGNGFTMTCAKDSTALDTGYSFVTLNNGTLDNVQIVCPNFDYAVLYKSNMTESGNRSETTDRTRYYNVKSGVMASGNSQILNSRISGGRAAVNVSGGNVTIDNSRIELGAVASVLVGAANNLTLRDVTLVQKPTSSTYDSSKTLMGFSVLFICDENGDTAPVTLEGTLIQNAWIDENDKQYVPSAGQSIISTVLGKTEYLHDIDGDGKNESLNLGFAYMPESLTSKVNATTITDKRTDKATIPYDYAEVSILSGKTYVYSYKNTNGTSDSFKNDTEYKPNKYGDIITVTYSDTSDGLTPGKSYGTDGWVHELNVDLDKLSGYALDFSKLSMSVNGVKVTDYKVNDAAKPTSPVAVTAGGTTYVLTATIDGTEYTMAFKVTGTETSKESPSLVAANYEAGLCVASSYGGTWHGAAPALQGIQIKYWSVAEKQYKTINLSDYTPTTKGQLNGTNTTWTYSPDNGDFTLTLTGGQVHSGNNVYAMPVVCDGKLYFVASKSSGLVNSGNSARTIPVSYSFKDNNDGDELKFSHTWSVAENKDDQYKYSDFCSGTKTKLEASSGGGCVAEGTLITLADGSQKEVQHLTGEEELLVWNLETGKYDTAPIVFVDSEEESEYEVIKLCFADGTETEVIYEHGFFDTNLGEYVYIDAENAESFVGHSFVKQDSIDKNTWKTVKLTDVVIETKTTTPYSPVSFSHLCYYVDGMLSMPGGIDGLFNIFEVDTDIMAYDKAKKSKDIETYGLYTYDDFDEIIPEIAYEAFNGAYLKVAIGKGMLTWEDIKYLAERYVPLVTD